MSFDENKGSKNVEQAHPTTSTEQEDDVDFGDMLSRQPSESSCYATEEEEEASHIQVGPKCTIKEHLEKDKVGFCS